MIATFRLLHRHTRRLGALVMLAASAYALAHAEPAHARTEADGALAVTLKALPTDSALSPGQPWWVSVSTDARPQLDGARERTAKHISDLFQNYSAGSFNDFDAWSSAVSRPSTALSERSLRGDWKCRTMHINRNGALAFPFHQCVVRQRGACLELAKESGRRWAGCLHRVDEKNFVLVQSRQYFQELSRVDGFLSGTSVSHLRLFVQRSHSLDIYELVRR